MTILPARGNTGTWPMFFSGIVTTTMSPRSAVSVGLAARALGPSSSTRPFSVSGPRELLITTSYPCATANLASWLPMCPAPINPITFASISTSSRDLAPTSQLLCPDPFRPRMPALGHAAVIGHLPARFAASMTFGLASLELVITFEDCAARRTSVADLSTGCARQAMPRRAAEHEVPAHVTDLDAIKQHSDVIMCHERAPPLKAMVQGPHAKRMTCFAVLDAATHRRIARILHCS